jgi:hypothetical protein
LFTCAATALMTGGASALTCSATAEQEAGKLAAKLIKEKVSAVVPVAGKQLINMSSCNERSGKFVVEFRYNFTGDAGLYWLEGEATLDPAGGGELKTNRASDNLKAAAAEKGSVLLASK